LAVPFKNGPQSSIDFKRDMNSAFCRLVVAAICRVVAARNVTLFRLFHVVGFTSFGDILQPSKNESSPENGKNMTLKSTIRLSPVSSSWFHSVVILPSTSVVVYIKLQ
jgi:hypothetical protein